jgi:hypothetical protein
MTSTDVIVEVGSDAWGKLTTDEQDAILASSDSNVLVAGLRVFDLLRKKFKPSYKLGKIYQAESDRYEAYHRIYCEYARKLNAGRIYEDVRTKPEVDQWRDLL